MKLLISREFENWLEVDENLDKWENGSISASEKRILITEFVGAAWHKLFSWADFKPVSYFQRTGCLLTLDGSEDNLLKIEGAPTYKPPMVVVNDDDGVELPEANLSDAEDEPNSDVTDDSDCEVEDAAWIFLKVACSLLTFMHVFIF